MYIWKYDKIKEGDLKNDGVKQRSYSEINH